MIACHAIGFGLGPNVEKTVSREGGCSVRDERDRVRDQGGDEVKRHARCSARRRRVKVTAKIK